MIGSLMYLTFSRIDLVQAVCYCARYQARPTEKHLKEVKRIFLYLKKTIHMGLWYPKDSGFELTAFSNADHAGYLDTRKSTFGEIQFQGDKLVGWMSKKHDCTAMSTAKAEYVALSASSIAISCNPVLYFGTKHINVRYYFIKEKVENGTIELYFVKTEYQLTDMFTKALSKERFKYIVRRLVLGRKARKPKAMIYTCSLPEVDMEKRALMQGKEINNSPIFVRYPNLQGNSDIGTTMEYRKALLASLDVPALDKPHIKLETYQEDSFQESNPDDAVLLNIFLKDTKIIKTKIVKDIVS
ncbi:hypothetical protein Tco_0646173 [Tanacetum coccineum]